MKRVYSQFLLPENRSPHETPKVKKLSLAKVQERGFETKLNEKIQRLDLKSKERIKLITERLPKTRNSSIETIKLAPQLDTKAAAHVVRPDISNRLSTEHLPINSLTQVTTGVHEQDLLLREAVGLRNIGKSTIDLPKTIKDLDDLYHKHLWYLRVDQLIGDETKTQTVNSKNVLTTVGQVASADKKLPRVPSATKLNMLSEQVTDILTPVKHQLPLHEKNNKSHRSKQLPDTTDSSFGRPSNR